jgi:hypothetical protein
VALPALAALGFFSAAGCSQPEKECPATEPLRCVTSCADTSDAAVNMQCVDGEWACPADHPIPSSVFGSCCQGGVEVAPVCSSGVQRCPTGSKSFVECSCAPDKPCVSAEPLGTKEPFCDYPDNACGTGSEGSCWLAPPEPFPASPPVCGCDGETYTSASHAAREGVDIRVAGGCPALAGFEPCGPFYCSTPGERCEEAPDGVSFTCVGNYCNGSADCPADRYCERPLFDEDCTLSGYCEPRPTECSPSETPVCGCDGAVYPSACDAAKAGEEISASGGCPPPPNRFACGPIFCEKETTYCYGYSADTSTTPITYSCEPLPAACTEGGATPTCACVADKSCAVFCAESAEGDLTLVCTAS